jgi:hypothetical protein
MADFPAPVANTIQPPDQSKGIATLSGMLGLQQQRQALQTGQYQQATAQAESEQAQQKNAEMQKAQAIAIHGAQSGKYTLPDGSLDRQKMADDINLVAPTYGQGIQTSLLSNANEILQNRQALQSLNDSQRKQVADGLGTLAQKPDLSNSDVIDWADRQLETNTDPAFRRMVISTLTHLPQNANSQQLRGLVGQFAAQTGGGGVQTPSTIDTGGQIIPGATNRFTGEFTPAPVSQSQGQTQSIPKTLSPTDQPDYRAKVARDTNLATGGATIDTRRADAVSAQAESSQGQIALTKQADRLVDMISSGTFPSFTAEVRKQAGSDDPAVVARYELKKVLGQLKDGATAHAGSDKQLATQLEQFPDETSPNEVIHSRMDNMRGVYRLSQERKDNLNSYQKAHGNLGGFQLSDDMVTSSRDPLTAELHSLPKGSPERQAFLKRTFKNPEAAQQAVMRERAAYHTVGAGNE